MSNVQQPEMRRSGHDRLVTDSAKERAGQGARRGKSVAGKDTRPAGQRSRYGPENPDSPEGAETGG